MTNKVILAILIFVSLNLLNSCGLPICGWAGSYACAIPWNLELSDREIIRIIEDIKTENPSLRPPGDSLIVRNSKARDKTFVYFYYPDTDEIVHTFIDSDYNNPNTKSQIVLLGFSDAKEKEKYSALFKENYRELKREINRDFKWKGNKAQINKFKAQILKPIRQKVEEQKKSNT